MPYSLTVNGTELSSYGFYPREIGGVHDVVDREVTTVPVRGRAGVMLTAPVREVGRTLTLSGILTPTTKTAAARLLLEEALRDALRAGLLTITRTDSNGSARLIEGMARSVRLTPIGHPIDHTDDEATIVVACRDAYWLEVSPLLRAVAVAATRYTTPLGTAPSSPIIRIMGAATNPVLTYRDAAGTAQRTMTFTVTLAATNDWLDVDMRTGKITKYVSGTPTNGRSLLTSGNFPWALDPQDGDYGTSQWPTIEVSAGTAEVLWWRQWA